MTKNFQFSCQLKKIHVLSFWMRHFPSRETIWIELKLRSELLYPLVRPYNTLREELSVPFDRLLKDKTSFVWLRSADLGFLHHFIADELQPTERDLAAHLTNEHLYLREDGQLAPEVLAALRSAQLWGLFSL